MKKLNVIITAAGSGSRFKEAGYPEHKPFLKIKGKYMIDHVIDAFPADVKKHIIVNSVRISEEQKSYLKSKPNTSVIEIEGHKEGPSYSIYNMRDKLPLDESFFVAYVDVFWTWNFDEVEKLLDYVFFLSEGRIILAEDAEDLRNKRGMSIDKLFQEVF